jgi:hypothetical protein
MENISENEYMESVKQLNMELKKLMHLEKDKKTVIHLYNISPGKVLYPEELFLISKYTTNQLYLIEVQKEIILRKENIVKSNFTDWNQKRRDTKTINKLKEKKEQKFQDELFLTKVKI